MEDCIIIPDDDRDHIMFDLRRRNSSLELALETQRHELERLRSQLEEALIKKQAASNEGDRLHRVLENVTKEVRLRAPMLADHSLQAAVEVLCYAFEAQMGRVVDWQKIRITLEAGLRAFFGPTFELRHTAARTFTGACSRCSQTFTRGDEGTIFIREDVGTELGAAPAAAGPDWFARLLADAGDVARRERAFVLLAEAAAKEMFRFACGCARDHLALRDERLAALPVFK